MGLEVIGSGRSIRKSNIQMDYLKYLRKSADRDILRSSSHVDCVSCYCGQERAVAPSTYIAYLVIGADRLPLM